MIAKLLALLLTLPGLAAAQGFAGLDSGGDGFAAVTAPAHLTFPRDHAPHPDFRVEWWYLTANLTGPDGASYGAQWTLFRQALTPGPHPDGWSNAQIWMGHAAVTSATTHRSAQTFARGGIGQADVRAAPLTAWIDDWTLTGTTPGIENLTLHATGADFSYDLRATTTQTPVPQGQNGLSLKSERGQASYYYSQPFYTVTGTLTLDGASIPVTGQGWLDREWSSQPLTPEQLGWDWFSLHLDSGAKVMVYAMRATDAPPFVTGTWIAPDGTATPLSTAQITLRPTTETRVAGRVLPTRWRLEIPDFGLAVDTEPLNAQSWMNTLVPYWEGPIRFPGGVGYLEMTGYR